MAALRKRKDKKGKKGKSPNDIVESEDVAQEDGAQEPPPEPVDLAAKAPEEATMDDEDVFGQPMKKGKGGKAGKKVEEEEDEEADDQDEDAGGRVKTKKEKEREKKEREKARKKEQVGDIVRGERT